MKNNIILDELNKYINSYLYTFRETEYIDRIMNILNKITGQSFKFNKKNVVKEYSILEFLEQTARLNEEGMHRKDRGVYYTPVDLADFMATNALLDNFNQSKQKLYEISDIYDNNLDYMDILNKKIIDPTCGNSEFLISVIKIKLEILKIRNKDINSDVIEKISLNLYGNDIDEISICISKVRLFLYLISMLDSKDNNIEKIGENINANFTSIDILQDSISDIKYDVIIGNPPYVESSRYGLELEKKYGNIYANILDISVNKLSHNGILAFVIPISYTSTPRMKKIRAEINRIGGKQVIVNFADRPDSLFSSAHQKLSVLFVERSKKVDNNLDIETYTSNYQYWYSEERKALFNNINIIYNDYVEDEFIPKLGNKIDVDIYKKILPTGKNSIFDYISNKNNTETNIYLNMRATFWIKVFLDKALSGEYKEIKCLNRDRYYLYCLFNSSLFFWYWIVVSDCWHITNKEFKGIKFVSNIDRNILNKFKELSIELEEELEKTKVYVGTRQTEYEYKHRECKHIIDKIDDQLAKVYKLEVNELEYIKNFAVRYRESRGLNNESN